VVGDSGVGKTNIL